MANGLMTKEPYYAEVIALNPTDEAPNGVFVKDDFNEVRYVADPPANAKIGDKIDLMKYASGPTSQL